MKARRKSKIEYNYGPDIINFTIVVNLEEKKFRRFFIFSSSLEKASRGPEHGTHLFYEDSESSPSLRTKTQV